MTSQTIRDDLAKLKKACDLIAERLDANNGYFSIFVAHQRIKDALSELREAFYELEERKKIKKFDDLISL